MTGTAAQVRNRPTTHRQEAPLKSFSPLIFSNPKASFPYERRLWSPIRILWSHLQTSDMVSADVLYPSQSPAKKQRLEGTPQHQSSSEDPRSKIEYYTYDEDVEDDSDGMHEMTDKEHEEYERQIKESDNRKLEFVKVVKANRQGVAGFLYFITFDVKDLDDIVGCTMEFQAEVWDGISKTTTELCRPKPSRE